MKRPNAESTGVSETNNHGYLSVLPSARPPARLFIRLSLRTSVHSVQSLTRPDSRTPPPPSNKKNLKQLRHKPKNTTKTDIDTHTRVRNIKLSRRNEGEHFNAPPRVALLCGQRKPKKKETPKSPHTTILERETVVRLTKNDNSVDKAVWWPYNSPRTFEEARRTRPHNRLRTF